MISDYEKFATGRTISLLEEDVNANAAELGQRIGGARVAVIGAAGSIGGSVVRNILRFRPRAITLIDLSENNLVELVRDLRSAENIFVPDDFASLPIGLGSLECLRFFKESKPFDYILNLSAIKHVRSEKDVYCLMRMIDTNVLFPDQLLKSLAQPCKNFFSVSSDKAANPANLMGASKMLMERTLLANSDRQSFSTARFANVAFSDGSLPHGFLQRIEKRQPLSAPSDVKRYFMSHHEAGQICVMSCILGNNRDVFFPNLEQSLHEKTFASIAKDVLRSIGFEPVECASESEARQRVDELLPQKKWPCYFFTSDTTGEKAFEEFYTGKESLDLQRYKHIGVIRQSADAVDRAAVKRFVDFANAAKNDSSVTKADYVREFNLAVPELSHVETGKNLDQKM